MTPISAWAMLSTAAVLRRDGEREPELELERELEPDQELGPG